VIEAFVIAFLLSDEFHNLNIWICCAMDIFLDLLDDELGLLDFVGLKTLSLQPLQSVI